MPFRSFLCALLLLASVAHGKPSPQSFRTFYVAIRNRKWQLAVCLIGRASGRNSHRGFLPLLSLPLCFALWVRLVLAHKPTPVPFIQPPR